MTDPAFILVKKLKPDARTPERATEGATGYDLYACLDVGIDKSIRQLKDHKSRVRDNKHRTPMSGNEA